MNKKQASLIINYEGLNKNENKSTKRLYFKNQFKFQLPKLPNSSSAQIGGQKTIANLIKSLQRVNKDPKNQLYPLLSECIQVLRGDKFLKKDLMIRKIQKTEIFEKENQMQLKQEYNMCKSQVINLEKSLIRKVQSKDLFQKVSKASYMKSQKITDRQLVNVLNNKIQEKDNLIRQLHIRIDQLNQNLNKQKVLVAAQRFSNQSILNDKQRLYKQNATKHCQIKEMNENLKKLNQQLEQKVSINYELEKKCKIFELQIKERENQLISLWQSVLLNSAKK